MGEKLEGPWKGRKHARERSPVALSGGLEKRGEEGPARRVGLGATGKVWVRESASVHSGILCSSWDYRSGGKKGTSKLG